MSHSTAEMPFVDFDAIEEIQLGEQRLLRIEGLVIHSSMVVSTVEQKLTPGAVQIVVHIELAKRGMTGSFTCFVPVTPDLHMVTFGLEKHALWHRTADAPAQAA
jgi:hypothetical protein